MIEEFKIKARLTEIVINKTQLSLTDPADLIIIKNIVNDLYNNIIY